jgi:hypothetical protein
MMELDKLLGLLFLLAAAMALRMYVRATDPARTKTKHAENDSAGSDAMKR